MSNGAPAYRDLVLNSDALRLVALREGGRTGETLATENGGNVLIRAPAHVHSAHAAPSCWRKLASPLPTTNPHCELAWWPLLSALF